MATETHPDDEILAQFIAALEKSGDIERVVAEYSERHPQVAERLRELSGIIGSLDGLRLRRLESAPKRLGDFRIVREISAGGMGRVYEAIQEPLGRRVAVKTIRKERLSPQMRARFLREQTVLASLHQTHIVPIHTAGQAGDLQYFAMPFIKGVTLQEIITRARRLHRRFPAIRTPHLAILADARFESADNGTHSPRAVPPSRSARTTEKAGPPPATVRLSIEYVRSVARVMLAASQAVHHVHDVRILHRDLKPSNLMVDTAGQCWIIDFGLAAYLPEGMPRGSEGPGDVQEPIRRRLTIEAGSSPGTPSYMAPEQWRGEAIDARTDVWGLGVTLYEMLTLRQAFGGRSQEEIRRNVEFHQPLSPRAVIHGVPRDLEAVCRKAMQKNPADRYPTAREFAADLRRWLSHEPVTAQRNRVPRRVWLWARRNRGWAAALVVLFLAATGLAAAQIQSARNRALFAETKQREERRERLLQQMQNLRLLPHQSMPESNWVDDGWALARQAAQIRGDDLLRDQSAAFLAGVSGRLAKELKGFEASSAAVDEDGRRVLLGGSDDDEARVWDSKTDDVQKSGRTGEGPVAFQPDCAAVQLVATRKDRLPLLLWDVGKRRLIRELTLPGDARSREAQASHLVMTPDGRFAAACVKLKDTTALVTLWDVSTADVVRQIPAGHRRLTSIAVSPEGSFLAAGDANGEVTVCSIADGRQISLPAARPTKLKCLAFGVNLQGRLETDRWKKWLLAAGDSGGTVTLWDLGRQAPLSYCRGSYYDVDSLAFSPDGVTLASAGHSRGRLWDIATGHELLELGAGHFVTGLAFSRDGKRLAASTAPGRDYDQHRHGMSVWDLEDHRGVQTLRGLSSQIAASRVRFNRDASQVAAVSLDWRVGIWDLPSGRLRHLFDLAPGPTADNTGLAFSPDGRKFAVSAGTEAKLWDLEAGDSISWRLPPGLVDTLTFDATGKRLFLFRMETAEGPGDGAPSQQSPRVGRMRDLLASRANRDLRRTGDQKPTWETDFFKARIFRAATTSDGRYVLVGGEPRVFQRDATVKGFECDSGKEVFSMPSGDFQLDATGQLVALSPQPTIPNTQTLLEFPSRKFVAFLNPCGSLGPRARFVAFHTPSGLGHALYRRGEKDPLVTLGIDNLCFTATFDPEGSRLAWGNQDGTVTVCYLDEVQRRLAGIGLGW